MSEQIPNGDQAAFASPIVMDPSAHTHGGYFEERVVESGTRGMSKRELIAMHVCATLAPIYHRAEANACTVRAVELTDALLAALSRAPEGAQPQ